MIFNGQGFPANGLFRQMSCTIITVAAAAAFLHSVIHWSSLLGAKVVVTVRTYIVSNHEKGRNSRHSDDIACAVVYISVVDGKKIKRVQTGRQDHVLCTLW
jgi:hypothetical protein